MPPPIVDYVVLAIGAAILLFGLGAIAQMAYWDIRHKLHRRKRGTEVLPGHVRVGVDAKRRRPW